MAQVLPTASELARTGLSKALGRTAVRFHLGHDTIIIKAITYKSSDAACCPTKKSTLIYKVKNGSLVNINR